MGLENTNLYRLPFFGIGGGISTEFGAWLPRGSKAIFVRSTGVQSQDEQALVRKILPSVQAAIGECRSGMEDVIFVLPGHTESVSSANYLSGMVAGTKIVGLGEGTARPTFTWTVAGSTILFNVANVSIKNCILNMEPGSGAVTVAAPITVSAAGCSLVGCQIRTSTDANNKTTIPVTTTAAGTDFSILGCDFFGATAGECTTMVRAVGADRLQILNCSFQGATSSTTVGVVQFLTTASTQVKIRGCDFVNRKAASVHALTGMAGLTGVVSDCNFGILDDATLAGFVTTGSAQGFRNQTVNLAGEEGAASTVVSA